MVGLNSEWYDYQTVGDDAKQKKAQPYDGGLYTDSSSGYIDKGVIPAVPRAPGSRSPQGTDGRTSVDTFALKQYANNLDYLADVLKQAKERVEKIPDLMAGFFKEADDLKQVVTGSESADGVGSGLRENLSVSLHDLRQILMETAQNIRRLASTYSSIDEINKKAGSDLHNLIAEAKRDLQKLQQDQL